MTESETNKLNSGVHIHRRLFGLAMSVHGFFAGIAIISFLMASNVILQMYLLSSIIAEVFLYGEIIRPDFIYYLAATLIIRSFLIWIRERFAQTKSVEIKSSLKRELFRKMITLGPSFTRTSKTGELIASITDGTEKLDDYFTRYIPSVIHIIILPAVIIIFTITMDWISGLILLLTAPLILFFMWLIGTYAKKLTQSQWEELSTLSSHFLDVLQGLKTLKIFGSSHRESDNVDRKSNGFRIVTMNVLKVAFLSGMVLELAASISIALVAVQVGIRLIEGMLTYQPGLFILLLAPEFYLPFRTLGSHHHAGMEGAAAAAGIFNITDQVTESENNESKPNNAPDPFLIQFKDVSFTYPGNTFPAIHKINCEIKPGTLTAVVGPTGAGKTTFAQLLLGYLKLNNGQILINNIPMDQLDMENWRKSLAYVPQHPHFFHGTILQNLMMANPGAEMDMVIHAAKETEAHHFIEKLPNGYHTQLDENAVNLSGGEKQRLAIARAFLKNAPVLILDEPTSNLDPESEQLISGAMQRIIKNRCTLVIAHRLNTVRRADNILVFKNGEIAEHGRHIDLVKNEGTYTGFLETIGITNQIV
ncbi:MAG: thiol reductant ABC exporter subunit CydD [Balneolaceae bacterium]|nr:MAG: thiol reductant ABC exporter subunit CydD [Balneolaceae bacterium]